MVSEVSSSSRSPSTDDSSSSSSSTSSTSEKKKLTDFSIATIMGNLESNNKNQHPSTLANQPEPQHEIIEQLLKHSIEKFQEQILDLSKTDTCYLSTSTSSSSSSSSSTSTSSSLASTPTGANQSSTLKVNTLLPSVPLQPKIELPSLGQTANEELNAQHKSTQYRPKRFNCPVCFMTYSNNGQLKNHVRIHTGERPFQCSHPDCNKSFTRNEELTRHKLIHTGVRPHSCNHCGKRFGRKDHLKKHVRTHDRKQEFQRRVLEVVCGSSTTTGSPKVNTPDALSISIKQEPASSPHIQNCGNCFCC